MIREKSPWVILDSARLTHARDNSNIDNNYVKRMNTRLNSTNNKTVNDIS